METARENLWVIGIGASAGGLEAISSFLTALPEDLDATYIVAQHLAPRSKSMLVELLGKKTKLPVLVAEDHSTLQPRQIIIIPPSVDAHIENMSIVLSKAGDEIRPKPSIDRIFHSIAQNFGPRSVGIILSGTGSDGTEGIRSIKEVQGLTIVQDSESAKYDGMPRSANFTGAVDFVSTPEKIASELRGLLLRHENTPLDESSLPVVEGSDLKEILTYLHKSKNIDFSQYKVGTIQRRLAKRVSHLGISNLREYINHLRKDAREADLLTQEMLISVTAFFRDEDAFRSLHPYLEKLVSRKAGEDEVRVWVAGCATGEEAYTLSLIHI